MSTSFKRGRSPITVLSPGASSVSGSTVSNNRLKSINRVANKKPRVAAAVRNNGRMNNSANERSEGMGNSEEMLVKNRRGVRTAANAFGQVRAATSPKTSPQNRRVNAFRQVRSTTSPKTSTKTSPKTSLQKQKNKTLKSQATTPNLKRGGIPRTAAQGAANEINNRERRLKKLISLRNKLPNVLKAKHTNDVLNRMSTRENMTALHLQVMQANLKQATKQVKKSPNKPANQVKKSRNKPVNQVKKSPNKSANNLLTRFKSNRPNISQATKTTIKNLYIQSINKINTNLRNKNKIGAQRILKYIYGTMSKDRANKHRERFPGTNAQKFMIKQLDSISKQTLPLLNGDLNINSGVIDLVFLIWCDMIHDGTINAKQGTGEMSFATFLQSDTIDLAFNKKFNFTYTPFMKDLVDVANKQAKRDPVFLVRYGTNKTATDIIKQTTLKYEDKWKEYMIGKIEDKSFKKIEEMKNPNLIQKPDGVKVYVSVDQEGNTIKEFSRTIIESYNKNEKKYKISGVLSFANLMDPGVKMPMHGLSLNNAPNNRAWNSEMAKFSNSYNPVLLNVTVGSFKFGYTLMDDGNIKLKLNDELYDIEKGSKVAAGESADSVLRWTKFMGDFMQIVTALYSQRQLAKKSDYYIPASGDGMFVVIYLFLASKLGIKPQLITSQKSNKQLVLLNLGGIINNSARYSPSRLTSVRSTYS